MIVLLIVIVAAFIIYTRIDAIMDYPAKYVEENAATETKATVTITEPSSEAASDEESTASDEGQSETE